MALTLRKGYRQLIAEAEAEIETLSVDEAIALHRRSIQGQNVQDQNVQGQGGDAVVFVDLRDPRELGREGRVPGAFHCPRGMLEFWLDPESPYARKEFQQDARFVFFCAAGWRSALATKTAQDMGLSPVAHIDGGFGAWKAAGGPVDPPDPR